MNKLFAIALISILAYSCIDPVRYDGDDVDCNYCFVEFPDSADLIIDLTINDENPDVEIIIYSGKADNSPIIAQFVTDTTTEFLYVPINAYYSVEAIYKSGDDKIRVIEGEMLEAKLVSELCSDDCWYIVGGEYNVKLKQ